MKKIFLFLTLLCSVSLTVLAQRGGGERIEALKVAFITEKLSLDSKTAEKFWPIYNQYESEMRTFMQQRKRDKDDLSAEDMLESEQKALDIKKKYAPQFLKVISNDQLSDLYRAEKEFRQMILRKMKNK